jgi:DUF4097 and DUF4098 domain-containing protein YvlB
MRVRAAGLIAVLVLPVAAGIALADPVSRYLHSEDSTTKVAGKVSSVKVDGDVSNVSVVPGKATSVVAHLEWNNNRPTVKVSLSKGVLTVTARCADRVLNGPVVYIGGTGDCIDNLRLTIPAAADVRVVTSGSVQVSKLTGTLDLRGGLVSVSNVRSPHVQVTSALGSVTLQSVTSPTIQVTNSQGGIYAKAISTRTLALSTSYGAVTVIDSTARTITASSDQGQVSAEQVQAELVDLSSSYGAVRVIGVRSPDVSAASDQGTVVVDKLTGDRLDARSGYGDILVSATAARRVNAVTDQGQVNVALTTAPDLARATSHYGPVAVQVPTGRYAVDATTDYGQQSVTGLVNDSTAQRQLVAHSDQGDVNVRGV